MPDPQPKVPEPRALLALAFALAAGLQFFLGGRQAWAPFLLPLALLPLLVGLLGLALRRGARAALELLGGPLLLRSTLELALGSVILASFLPEDPLTAGDGLAGLLLRAGLAHPEDGTAFHLLVLVCAVASLAAILRGGLRPWRRRLPPVLAHLSLLLVLVAAAHSHFWSQQGLLELEEGRSSSVMLVQGPGDQIREAPLPFTLRLEDFRVERQRQPGALWCSLAPQAPRTDEAGTVLGCAGAALVVQKEIRALPLKVPALGPDGQEIEVTRFVQTEEGARALLLGRSAEGRTDLVLFPGEQTPLPGTAATLLWVPREDHLADYLSSLRVHLRDGSSSALELSVNRPGDVGPWRILQHGFSPGREDRTTLLIVYEPLRPVLYLGLLGLCLASLLLALGGLARFRRGGPGGEAES